MQWSTRSAAQSCADGLSFTMKAQRGKDRFLGSLPPRLASYGVQDLQPKLRLHGKPLFIGFLDKIFSKYLLQLLQ